MRFRKPDLALFTLSIDRKKTLSFHIPNSIKRTSFESWIGAGVSLDTGVDLATQCALQRVLADIPAGCFHILPLEVCEATHMIAGLGRQIYKGHCKALNTDLAY